MITEDYVSFEIAKLLQEKGFDESTSMVYMSYGELCKLDRFESICNSNYNDITKSYFKYTAPTLQMAMKWLREVHHYLIVVGNKNGNYLYLIKDLKANTDLGISDDEYIRYEEACESAIKYCLENLI